MPVRPTYPGVYIEEIPSGVRTITGVATSITAFIGRAKRGPVNEPITVNSLADFQRTFGGLWKHSAMSYAVRDFYANGGGQAIIVRLYRDETGAGAKPDKAKLTIDTLELEAAYEGAWGNELRARVDHDTRELEPGEAADSLFNLSIRDGETGDIETLRNLSVTDGHPRQVDKVLENESKLVRLASAAALPASRPAESAEPAPGDDAWGDTAARVQDSDEASDGLTLQAAEISGDGREAAKEGLYALLKADLFNLLCIPPYKGEDDPNVDSDVLVKAAKFCEDHRAMLVVDAPSTWVDKRAAKTGIGGIVSALGESRKNAALFFPRIKKRDPERDNQLREFVPCGAAAAVFARTDGQAGVWKAPAGLQASIAGVSELSVPLTDDENGELNPLAINCLRSMPPVGPVIWGSRTLAGDDRTPSDWKYIPVRRLALFIEESLYRGTQWVVFEPNDEQLWGQIRSSVGAFMHSLFRQGAFQGSAPRDAYFVKCDKETTTQNDINLGIVNIVVGFAPLKPAEFVIVKIQQIAGQT